MIQEISRTWVIDASVLATAFFQEELEKRAWALLTSEGSLLAPAMVIEEFGNVIWKRFRLSEIESDQADDLLADCLQLPLQITPSTALIQSALSIAMEYDRSVHDSLYLALAVRSSATMVTVDKRLVNALAGTPLEQYVKWLGNL